MDTLYSGQPGVDFVLKASFKSVEEMTKAFAKGPDYKGVWYGEHCIIDTPNKNHKDNGKIYQRGLDYLNGQGGANYIGQIVGPSSGTPYFQLASLQAVQDISKTASTGEYDYKRYPIAKNEDGTYRTDDKGDIYVDAFGDANSTSMVPGKYKDDAGVVRYHDDIRYTWVNIRKANAESDSWFYVGIEMPYMVTDYSTHMVTPYDEYGQITDKTLSINRIDDMKHPFYAHWDLGIPKGIKGDTLRNLRVIVPTSADTIYDFTAISIDSATGEVKLGKAGYAGLENDIANKRQIVVFDYYIYDKLRNPTPITIYLGDFNIISDVKVADNGTLTVSYTHNDKDEFVNKIQWIASVKLDPVTGDFTVKYNNETEDFETTLDWIRQITLDDDGTLHFIHTENGRDERHDNAIKWIKTVTLNDKTGEFRAKFNYGDDYISQLDWVTGIEIDDETGEITVKHINPSLGNQALTAKLKIVTGATASADGVVTFTTNTDESFNLKDSAGNDYHIKAVESVLLNESILQDQRIQIKYNTATTPTPIGTPINYIYDMVVRQDDYHLLVLFSDPAHRRTAADLDEAGRDARGIYWYNDIDGSDGTKYDSSVYWRDCGAIKDQSGVLIGLGITNVDLNSGVTAGDNPNKVINYLNWRFPHGLTQLENGISVKGKIVTYSPNEGEKQEFYAFDYSKEPNGTWYYLGEIADNDRRDAAISYVNGGQANSDALLNLTTGGLMFMEKKITVSENPIPEYWSPSWNNWN